jgi:hypothetical protein
VETLRREHLRQVSHLHRAAPVRGWSRTGWSSLRSPTLLAAVVLGVVTLVLRLSYAASGPTGSASASYVIGSGRFDVTRGAPGAPGYWLYVAAGHAVHVVTGLSPVHSLVLLAALASAGAAALTCVVGTDLGGRWVGLAAGALVASAPVSWFAGATVATYSFDALVGALVVVLAHRARPYGAHGVAAVVGLGAGFRPWVVPLFALLAAIAVVASVRTVGQLLATVVGAVGSVAVWFVPMILVQPGGAHAWLHAVRAQISSGAHASSVFAASSSGAVTNLGTFAAWTLVSLAGAVVVGALATVGIMAARIVTRRPAGDASLRIWSTPAMPGERSERPWYQTTGAVLVAAVVPPVAVVSLGRFAAGGDVLSYLAPATVLLLLPVGRLVHHRVGGVRRTAAVVATVVVAATVAVNVQRFVAAPGILPADIARHQPGLWISRARYQAPYADTAATIGAADRADRAFAQLRSMVDPATDVIVCVSTSDAASAQNGAAVFRSIGLELPGVRVALVHPFADMELGGLLYPHHGRTLAVGPGGHALFLVPPSPASAPAPAPALGTLAAYGLAVRTPRRVAGFDVWRVAPGATLFGVRVTAVAGDRPL